MNTSQPITFSKLTKSLQQRRLFQDLHLAIQPGECTVLSGDNGEGKTTLLRILAGLLVPDAGQCRYNGSNYSWKQSRDWLLHNVVYLHQEPYLFDSSVLDNITYGLRRRGIANLQARAIALTALHNIGLTHVQQRNARQLSGGEKQRVALLRAWVLSPRLLLLDEPVTSMDEGSRHRTLFLIRRLLQDGVSLLITTHEPRLFAPIADRHILLRQGQLHTITAMTRQLLSLFNTEPATQGDCDEQRYPS